MHLATFSQPGSKICSATSSLSTLFIRRSKKLPRQRTPRRSTSGTDASPFFSSTLSLWLMRILTLSTTSSALTRISCRLTCLSLNHQKRKPRPKQQIKLLESRALAGEFLHTWPVSLATASRWLTALSMLRSVTPHLTHRSVRRTSLA